MDVRTAPLALVLALAACTPPAPLYAPSGPPTVRGTVTSIRHSATASGLMVEPGGGACGMQATLDAETRVYRRSASGALTLASVGAITEADRVEVYAAGPVQESCPLQGRAGVVVIGAAGVDADLLVGHWVHAQEEDVGDVEVYRRDRSQAFPPRMYRQRYVFRRDGRAEVFVPDPADAHRFVPGTWALDPERPDVVRVRYGDRTERFRVLDLRADRLRIERRPSSPRRPFWSSRPRPARSWR